MSQMLQTKSGPKLYQDLFFSGTKTGFGSSVNEAICYVCGKGLQHGFAVTAKKFSSGILLFCGNHYSM